MQLLREGAAKLGIRLTLAQVAQFHQYYETVSDWNSRVNLTSVAGREEVQTVHFLDSLTVCLAIPERMLESGRFVDVGSGAGFPGVPLKIAFPGLRTTLIDSTAKKTRFLVELIRILGLSDIEVLTERAEDLAHDPDLRERSDFVVARAVAQVPVLAELTLPFCRVGGVVVLHKKLDVEAEVQRGLKAVETLGGTFRGIEKIGDLGYGDARGLVVMDKVRSTPRRFPRRPGVPRRRPL